MASRSSVAPSAPRVPTRPMWKIVTTTVWTMVLVLPADFFWTYAFNDDVGWDDHRAFLVRVAEVVVVLGVVLAAVVRLTNRVPLARAVPGSLLVTSSVVLLAGAGYAALSVLPAMDPAIGASATNAECVMVAALLLALSTGAFRMGRELVEPTDP